MSTTAFRHEAGTAIECLSVSCFETYLDGWHLFSNHSITNKLDSMMINQNFSCIYLQLM